MQGFQGFVLQKSLIASNRSGWRKLNPIDFSDTFICNILTRTCMLWDIKEEAPVFCHNILPESPDPCEAGRFSCYIGPDMRMTPCSFDQESRYQVQLGPGVGIQDAWDSETFWRFRAHLSGACPGCRQRELCLGRCPLMPEIVFCSQAERTAALSGKGNEKSK